MSPSPWRLYRFLLVGFYLFQYSFSLYLSRNHSLGLVLKFLNHLLLIPSAQLGRKTETKSDLCPKVPGRCLACRKSENVCQIGIRKLLPFLLFKNSVFSLCYQPPSPDIQCDDPKPNASVLVMSCKIGHPILKRSSVSVWVGWLFSLTWRWCLLHPSLVWILVVVSTFPFTAVNPQQSLELPSLLSK